MNKSKGSTDSMESLDLHTRFENMHCPVKATLELIGGKYKIMIIYHLLLNGTMRFHEIEEHIPEATPKMLTQRLRELESDGIIVRKVYPEVPPKTEYSLTELGKSLTTVMEALREWGNQNLQVW